MEKSITNPNPSPVGDQWAFLSSHLYREKLENQNAQLELEVHFRFGILATHCVGPNTSEH